MILNNFSYNVDFMLSPPPLWHFFTLKKREGLTAPFLPSADFGKKRWGFSTPYIFSVKIVCSMKI